MLQQFGVLGYIIACLGYFALTLLLITSWQGRTQGIMVVLSSVMSCFWAALAAQQTYSHNILGIPLVVMETFRGVSWTGFVYFVLRQRQTTLRIHQLLAVFIVILLMLLATSLVIDAFSGSSTQKLYDKSSFDLTIAGLLLIAISGVIVVEQLFRNISEAERWSLKYLCFGVGAMFIYDLLLYGDALFFRKIDPAFWQARGYINAMIVPLIAIAAARNPEWSLDVFVSRRAVFFFGGLLGVTLYLLIMFTGAYYIRYFGGSWGRVAQLVFLFVALTGLAMLVFSGQVRSWLKIFVNVHFFNYRYDYRGEWLKFINSLSGQQLDAHLRTRVIASIAELVESPAGALWVREDHRFKLKASWNVRLNDNISMYSQGNDSLVHYLKTEQAVVNLNETDKLIADERLTLPAWIDDIFEAWLVVPLLQQEQLYGFIVLTKSRADLELNWENMDLLITTGREACNHLALLSASEKLSESRQFEAFNRLSAYVVHDLKNIVAQLNLLVKNAEKHKENPEFVSDAFETVKNSVNKMSRMLLQLQKSKTGEDLIKRTDLNQALQSAINNQAHNAPGVQWQEPQQQLYVLADNDRLTAVLQHLIQNAQEATADDGQIVIEVKDVERDCVVDIRDSGVGMDKDFLENRLFKPFDTTKGNAGMGIGVYESRETLRSFGGDLLVSSELGQGTTFSLVLKKYSERMLDS